jgi:biopolymer transport protein ExbD
MRFRNFRQREQPSRLKMAAMIDIVFLLLVFFVMTFTIAAVEGDFAVEAAQPTQGNVSDTPPPPETPMDLRLMADPDGALKTIRLNDRYFSDFDSLHTFVLGLAAERSNMDEPFDGFVVVLNCDEQLDYKHVIDAITAVTGDLRSDGTRVELISSIRFR